jgi:hypothetical protein
MCRYVRYQGPILCQEGFVPPKLLAPLGLQWSGHAKLVVAGKSHDCGHVFGEFN